MRHLIFLGWDLSGGDVMDGLDEICRIFNKVSYKTHKIQSRVTKHFSLGHMSVWYVSEDSNMWWKVWYMCASFNPGFSIPTSGGEIIWREYEAILAAEGDHTKKNKRTWPEPQKYLTRGSKSRAIFFYFNISPQNWPWVIKDLLLKTPDIKIQKSLVISNHLGISSAIIWNLYKIFLQFKTVQNSLNVPLTHPI